MKYGILKALIESYREHRITRQQFCRAWARWQGLEAKGAGAE